MTALTFNWVDVLTICIFARVLYVGKKNGLIPEIFKTFGVFLGAFFALHYYVSLGFFLQRITFGPLVVHEVLAFVMIVFLIATLFWLIREGWMLLLKIDVNPVVNAWGGLVFSFVRGYLICGLVFFVLLIPDSKKISDAVSSSMSSVAFDQSALALYQWEFDAVVKTIFPREVMSKKALLTGNLERKEPRKRGEDWFSQ